MGERPYLPGRAGALAGVTYRQIDHWYTRGLISGIPNTKGRWVKRRFSLRQVLELRALGRLSDHFGQDLETLAAIVREASDAELTGDLEFRLSGDLRCSIPLGDLGADLASEINLSPV